MTREGVCWLDFFGSAWVSFVSALEWRCGGFSLSGGQAGAREISIRWWGGEGLLAN